MHPQHRRARAPGAALATALLATTLATLPVRTAAADDRSDPEGIPKLFAYLSCAVGVAFANSPQAAIGAALGCIQTFIEELKEP